VNKEIEKLEYGDLIYFKGEYIYWNDFLRKGMTYNGRNTYEIRSELSGKDAEDSKFAAHDGIIGQWSGKEDGSNPDKLFSYLSEGGKGAFAFSVAVTVNAGGDAAEGKNKTQDAKRWGTSCFL